MKEPKIAIITPTLNQGGFIEKTIQSILGQQNVDLDYIVVDAGSTDNTTAVLKKYGADLNWVVKPGMGQSAAINWGWRQTKAPIISWLNSDDVLLPGALEKVESFFSTSPETDIFYGKCDYIDQYGDYIAPYPTRDFTYRKYVSGAENFIPQSSTFLTRRVFETLGGVDEGLNLLMDFDYWIRVGLTFKIQHRPEILSQARLHGEAKSTLELPGFANELLSIYERFFARPELPQELLALKNRSMRNANLVAANMSFWAQDFKKARDLALHACKISPLSPSPFLPLYLMGKSGFSILKRLQKNPYIKYP